MNLDTNHMGPSHDDTDKSLADRWERACLACNRIEQPGYSCQLVFVRRQPIRDQAWDPAMLPVPARDFGYGAPLFVTPYLCLSCLRRLHMRDAHAAALFGALLIVGLLIFSVIHSSFHPLFRTLMVGALAAVALYLGERARHTVEDLLITLRGGKAFSDLVGKIANWYPVDPWDHWPIKHLCRQAKPIGKHHHRTDCFVARLWNQNIELRGKNAGIEQPAAKK